MMGQGKGPIYQHTAKNYNPTLNRTRCVEKVTTSYVSHEATNQTAKAEVNVAMIAHEAGEIKSVKAWREKWIKL